MPALAESAPPANGTDNGALSKTQKLAALLVMLGSESAAEVLKGFQPAEIEPISREMARFNLISQWQQEDILVEFSQVAVEASTSIAAGVDVTRNTLERALGSFKASDILGRILPARAPVGGAMQAIAEMDPRHLLNLVRDEQPQTIAFVVSHLTPERGAQVLNLLRPEQRDVVVERLATLAPTPVEVAEKVVEVLNAKLGVKQTRALSQTGGVTTAADMLNAMDKGVTRIMLASMEERNPDLCNAIRKKMFTFEDLLSLNTQSIQRIMRETDMRDLSLSLKKASEPLKKLLLSNISRRAAEAVNDEMSFMGHVKLRDVEAAQFRIIDAVRKLEAEGEIDLDEARSAQSMKWSDTLTLTQPLRDVRPLTPIPALEAEHRQREAEAAAYERGRRDAEKSLREQLLQQRSELLELHQGVVNSLRGAVSQVVAETEDALLNLALEAAQRLVAGIKITPKMVEAVVREALSHVEDNAEITVHLHADDLALLRKHGSPLLGGTPDNGPLRFVGSTEVFRGDCLVQTRFGLLDARRETKLQQLRQSLNA